MNIVVPPARAVPLDSRRIVKAYASRAIDARDPKLAAKETIMLWTIAVVLLTLWALGFAMSYTMGGLIHLLIALAIVMVVIRLVQGRA
jgi:hypothetical protein